MAAKILFLIADGMGGYPLAALGGKTTLEAAATPTLDALARAGVVGLCRTVPPGMAPGSDVANMALLGFNPRVHHTGRGPIEAAAQGVELAEDDLVFRLNLVALTALTGSGVMRDYSAGHIETDAARALIGALSAMASPFTLYPGVQYRHLLVYPGQANGPAARLAVRPPHDITGESIAPDLAQLASCPELLAFMERAAAYLQSPANPTKAASVWPWGQGRALHLPSFAGTFGLRGGVVTAVDLVRGLGRGAGMEILDAPGATGLLDTNYEGKVEAALDFLKRGGDFVFVHLEGPDECGHGGDTAGKIEAISRFDARIVKPLVHALADTGAALLVACDHLTPVAMRTHAADPVPFLFWKSGLPASGPAVFSERSAAAAGVTVDPGFGLLPFVLRHIR
ncbi:MAG: 2,3-bisphosphoglycerate-independent phosphoglycerate mutase [Desulfovibrionaceae bacterium]|nr:2,3-bisphosphoglycerate-independent phosphoglycerate mutase [Desulfovibrionaceae bacterium]MBF0514214.1 2,3-bisphosphoglycerate-independent phosphoglycerate mutase [Desulfovibrionaceae bacterium]